MFSKLISNKTSGKFAGINRDLKLRPKVRKTANMIIVVGLLVFWIMMIVDVAKRDETQFPNSTGNSKTIWLVVVILLGWIGGLVYYFAVKRKAPLPK